MNNKSAPVKLKRRHFFVLMFFISTLLAIGGYLFYTSEAHSIRENKHNEIKAIADLKIQQIIKWRQERNSDINVVSQSPFFIKGVKGWLNNRNNDLLNDEITERLLSIKQQHSYEDVLLATGEGELLFQIDSQFVAISPQTKEKIIETVKSRKVTFTDFYECKEHNKIHYDIIAPLIDEETNLFAVLIFRVDPNEYLYPLIQNWPTISRSSETLLVRKENNNVLFLNELRHRKNTALKLTVPITSTEVPAVQATLGFIGVFEGKDYRGIEVLAYIEPVPDTQWYIIAKVDKDEIYAELNQRAVLITIFIIVLIFLSGLGLSLFHNSRQKNIYRQLFHKEKELRESQEEFRTTLYSIGDAVITTDKNGNIKQMNFVAEQLTGWKEDEAKDKVLENVFNIINEGNREKVENPVARVLKEGIIVGLANHTLLISKDGTETPIADSGAPIKNEEGEIIGVVLVFRDQIKEREQQIALQKSEEFIRTILDNLPIGIAVNTIEPSVEFEYINDNFVKYYRTTKDAISKPDSFWEAVYEDPEFRDEIKKRILDDCASGKTELMHWQDVPITRKGQATTYITARNIPVPEKNIAISTVWDVTQRKLAEENLIHSEKRFRSIVEGAPDPIFIQTEYKFAYLNPAACKLFGIKDPAELIGLPVMERFHPDYKEKILERIKRLNFGREPVEELFEQRFIRMDGSEVWVETVGEPIIYEGKEGALVFVRDITERKLAELEIIKFNRVYALLSNTNQAIVRIHERQQLFNEICRIATEEGKFLLAWIGIIDDKTKTVNVASFAQQIITKSGEKIPEVSNIEQCQFLSQKVIETRNYFIVNDIKNDDPILSCKNCALLSKVKSAAAFPIIVFGNLVGTLNLFSEDEQFFHDEEIKLLDEMSKDISFALEFIETDNKRRETEETLLYEQHLLHTLMDSSPDYIYFKDSESRFLRINNAQAALFGLKSPKDAVGKTDADFFAGEHAQQAYQDEQTIIRTGKSIIDREEKETWPDESITWVSTTKIPLRDTKGEIIGTFGVSRSITDRKRVELALRESEAFYYSLVENIQASIFRKDREGRFVFVNSIFCKLKGLSEAEIIGKTPSELTSYELKLSDSRLETYQQTMLQGEEHHQQIMNTGKNIEIEEVYLQSDGTKLFYYVIKSPIIGADGQIIGTQGIQFDITRNRKVEEEIKMLAHSISSINECLSITDKNDNFIFVNEAFLKTYGYTKKELIGNHISILRPPNVTQEIGKEIFAETMKSGWKGELLNMKKDGTVFPIYLSTSVIKDELGTPIALIGVATDITESKNAEEVLRKLSRAVEQSPASVIITDKKGCIEYVNRKFCDITGYSKEEVIGQNPRFMKSGRHDNNFYKMLWDAILSGKDFNCEMLNKKKNGELYWVSQLISPLLNNEGELTHFVAIIEDITEKKKMIEDLVVAKEKAEKSDRLKSEFLAQMSHEIRSPLNVTLSYANLIRDELGTAASPDFIEYFEGIETAGRRLIRTVDLILNTSEIHVGTFEPTFVELNLIEEIIESIKNEYQRIAENKGLELKYFSNVSKAVILGDKYSIYQIFVNLIDNAVKYTHNGFIAINVSENKNTNQIVTEIEDTGIGMSEEFMKIMFEPFVQEEQGYSRRFEGNGLGLTLVKKYCDLNGIEIKVESEKEKGSKFTLIFDNAKE